MLPTWLFASPAVIVPGDVVTADLWVRNSSGDPARVDLVVAEDLGVGPGTLAGDLSLTIDGGSGTRRRPAGTVRTSQPGGRARITLVVTFDAASQSTSQASVATVLDLPSTLVQTDVGPAVVADRSPRRRPPTSGGSGLAHTGGGRRVGHGVRSLGAVLVGLLLVAARRRSRRAEG